MILMALLWSTYAHAFPLGNDASNVHIDSRGDSVYTDPTYGTSTQGRLAYGLMSYACLFALAFVLGVRVKRFDKNRINFAWVLVHLQTFIALGLVISSSILVVSLGTTTQKQCFSAILVCVVFYTTAKMCLSMFLLERLHIIRAPFVRKRTDDRLWLGGTLFLFASLGAISIWSLVTPHAELSSKDGQCRIGIARVPSYTLFTFDVIMNAALTIAFVILLRPYLELRERTSAYHGEGNPPAAVGRFRRLFRQIGLPAFRKDEEMDSFSSNIRNVLWKNVIGSSLALLASLANQIVSFTEKHNQGAFVCLMGCMADVTCGVLVVHWLTLGSNEETQALQPPRGHTASLSSSSTITPATKSEHTSKNPQTHT